MRLALLAAAPGLAAATWDITLLSNCLTCSSDTQPACMQLLETANTASDIFDPVFAAQVTCAELEFAFECVVLENKDYPDGYLDYFFGVTGNTVADCETYADNYDTMKCNVVCAEAGGNVQEGATEFFCEQCTQDTVADCYYFLGYSDGDDTISCDAKQLALDCLTKNFTAYPEGYLAWMSSQRVDLTCDDIAADYSTTGCQLHCGECSSSCLFSTCDKWVEDGVNTCAGLELSGCDCSGCTCSAGGPAPAPGIDDGWVTQEATQCGRGGDLVENQLAIGTDGLYYDTVDNQNFFVDDCKRTCEEADNCGGFALEFGVNQECWYLVDTRLYVESSQSESCYTYRVNATAIDVASLVAKCSQCSVDTSFADCQYLVDNAYDLSWDQSYSGSFCGDLQTALDCATAGSTAYPEGYIQTATSQTCTEYLAGVDTGLCSPTCSDAGDSSSDVSLDWCTTCRESTATKCFEYLTTAAHDATTSCADLSTAMSCLNSVDYFASEGIQCAATVSALNPTCGLQCPAQCQATCSYQSCDDIIGLTDVVTCAQMENAWGCDCSGCACDSSAATLNALGYSAVVGTSCYVGSPLSSDNNRATISSLGASYAVDVSVDDCAAYCGSEPSVCGGFSYDLVSSECIFVANATRVGTLKGEYLCLENTGEAITTTTSPSYQSADDGSSDPSIPAIVSVATIVVVGVIIGLVVWKVNDAKKNKSGGFSPQNRDRPTTYAAPPVPSPEQTPNSTRRNNLNAIDEERQIDQDGAFEL